MLQGALLGVVGLLLAFGLSLAVSRYEDRRANVVTAANAIGTTYLRAQTLPEPIRSRSLALLVGYTRNARDGLRPRAGQHKRGRRRRREDQIERRLWALAAESLDRAPLASAPKLYVETLNDTFDAETARVVALSIAFPPRSSCSSSRGLRSRSGCWPPTWRSLGRGEGAPSSSRRCWSRSCCS